MAISGRDLTTTDFIAGTIIAIALGFIVYEIVQGIQSVENALGGWLGPLLAIFAVIAALLVFGILF